MNTKTKILAFKLTILFLGLVLLHFLSKFLVFLAIYSYDIDINYMVTGIIILILVFIVFVFYKKVTSVHKIFVLTVLGTITLIFYYKYTLTPFSSVAYIDKKFTGSVFIAFNQKDAKKIPVINNLLTLSILSENPYTGRTATTLNEFFFRNFYFIDNDETISSEAIEEATLKRIFEFKVDSIIGPSDLVPFYFIQFYVTPDKMTKEEYLQSSYKTDFENFKDSAEVILKNKFNELKE